MTRGAQTSGIASIARAYIDLTRAHFAIVWPVLFLSGLILASTHSPGLTWTLAGTATLIGLIGFEAGMVLNDIVDRRPDEKDIDPRFSQYWRPFGTRPLHAGLITPSHALALFVGLAIVTIVLILTLPFPHSAYVVTIMLVSYGLEVFYQLEKRDQHLPVAQLLGRVDLALFPVAGYLILGSPDITTLLIFLVFYPWAEAHLGVNDLADLVNDQARGMKTIPILFGIDGCVTWIALFSVVHFFTACILLPFFRALTWAGFLTGFLLILLANHRILKERTPEAALGALPLFHASLLIYAVALISGSIL